MRQAHGAGLQLTGGAPSRDRSSDSGCDARERRRCLDPRATEREPAACVTTTATTRPLSSNTSRTEQPAVPLASPAAGVKVRRRFTTRRDATDADARAGSVDRNETQILNPRQLERTGDVQSTAVTTDELYGAGKKRTWKPQDAKT